MSVLIDQKGFTKIGIKMLNEKLERVTSIPLLECNELGEESDENLSLSLSNRRAEQQQWRGSSL